MEFNRLISNVEPSKSVTLLAKTKELQKTDPEILNLTGGEPDFPTPKAVCDTALTAAETLTFVPALPANCRKKITHRIKQRIF